MLFPKVFTLEQTFYIEILKLKIKDWWIFGYIFYFPGLLVFLYMTIGYVGESIQRGERGMDTTWMPYMWPIKTCLLVGIIFLLIQGISELLKSYWAAKKGEWPGESK